MIRQAMILAAGLGTRMKPYSDLLPKPLLPLLGKPAIQYVIDQAYLGGVRRVVINTHAHSEKMRQGLKDLELHAIALATSDESDKLLGNAGGIRKVLDQFSDKPFFVINSDQVFDLEIEKLAQTHQILKEKAGVKATLAILPRAPKGEMYREILVDYETGKIKAIGEKKSGRPFFCGVAVFEPSLFKDLPLGEPMDLLEHILMPAVERGELGACLMQGLWLDLGSPLNWMNAHFSLINLHEQGKLGAKLKARIEKSTLKLSPKVWVGGDAATVSPEHYQAALQKLEHVQGPVFFDPLASELGLLDLVEQYPRLAIDGSCVLYGAPGEGLARALESPMGGGGGKICYSGLCSV